jgi:hypothetical protein
VLINPENRLELARKRLQHHGDEAACRGIYDGDQTFAGGEGREHFGPG